MQTETVTSQGREHVVTIPDVASDLIPVPVSPCEAGYKPQHQYLVEDAYMYRVGPRRWRMRFTGPRGVDSWTDHPTLRSARQHFTHLVGLDLTELAA